MITIENVKQVIANAIEEREPQNKILEALRAFDGKRLDKRVEEKLRAICNDDSIRIIKRYSTTEIEWGGYSYNRGNTGGLLVVAYQLKNVVIDVDYIKQKNPAYFDALDQRNAQRQELLAQPDKLEYMATTMQAYLDARDNLQRMWGFDLLSVDRYKFEEKFNLKNGH